jgi:hypothetical protein
MTIYVLMDGNTSFKAYKNVNYARQQMDATMFAKCKRGFRILETKNDSYTYCDPNNASVKYRLYLNEVELQE